MGLHKDEGDPSLALVEECAEVIQVIAKMHRFKGNWFEIPPGKDKTRFQELKDEIQDVIHQIERTLTQIETQAINEIYTSEVRDGNQV